MLRPPKMLRHLDPANLRVAELKELSNASGIAYSDLCQLLVKKHLNTYDLGTVRFMISKVDQTLILNCVIQKGPAGAYIRKLITLLKKLAAAAGCSEIETETSDPRIKKIAELHGAWLESWTLRMEADNGK